VDSHLHHLPLQREPASRPRVPIISPAVPGRHDCQCLLQPSIMVAVHVFQ
jgi:hypothetical protein